MHRRIPLALLAGTALALGTFAGVPAIAAPVAPSAAGPAPTTSDDGHADFDLRQGTNPSEKRQLRDRAAKLQSKPAVQTLVSDIGGQAVVDVDPVTATPREVAKLDGMLTAPSGSGAADVALRYVRAHAAAFGLTTADISALHLARDYVDVSGIHHLSWTQQAGGIPVFGNGLKANVTQDGRLINVLGAPVTAPAVPSQPVALTGADAIRIAKRDLGEASTAPKAADVVTKVLFRTAAGMRIAWRTITMSAQRPALHIVDAQSGRLLLRQSLSADYTAGNGDSSGKHALVYENYPGAPAGGSAHDVNLTALGYLAGDATVLSGNNAQTSTDVNDDDVAQGSEQVAPAADGSFRFPLKRVQVAGEPCTQYVCTWRPDAAYSWKLNRSQTATQNFYFVNRFHDHLQARPIGFTEAAGNFQLVNRSGNGVGGDPVIDQPLDGASVADGLPDFDHIDNANMSTPPDGISPTMQMYLFHAPGTAYPDEDPFLATSGADDSDVVYHEYTHGLSNRLVVDASGVSTLISQQAGSMGEAWSDWYAFDYLVDEGYTKDTAAPGEIHLGADSALGQNLFRSEPLDCAVHSPASACPGGGTAGSGGYTYGDFGKISGFGPEVHADGEIWAQTLWQLRGRLGTKLTESLVTRAMELSPADPSYLDMRNAILQADVACDHGRRVGAIWSVFASRGMGFFAGTLGGSDVAPVESFSLPPAAGSAKGVVKGLVTDGDTTKPVSGITVAFGGHDSGFPGSYSATTDTAGRYTIPGVFAGTYPDVYTGGGGYDTVSRTLTVRPSTVTAASWKVRRDWAASPGGASVSATNGDEYAEFGCGAAALIDQSAAVGWSADLPTTTAGKYAVVALPKAVDLTSITIDPSYTCGDDPTSSTAGYRVETSRNGTTWTIASAGTFPASSIGHANAITLRSGSAAGVRYIRYTMLTTQAQVAGCAADSADTGCSYLDSSELEAYGR